jgi:hypothetical protein
VGEAAANQIGVDSWAYLQKIRLFLKSLPETNSLGYYEHSQIMSIKSFITFGPDCIQILSTGKVQ